MNYYIGIDLGTSVIKGTAVDEYGKISVTYSKETPLIFNKSDWVEQSPEYWWSSTLEIINLIGTKINLKNVKGIGLSGQMHGLVVYDDKFSALRRAIVWMDKRSINETEKILDLIGSQKYYRITGNPVFSGFLLPSLLWIKNNEPDIFKKIYKVSSPKDYLAYKLTGNVRSEPTDALATGAFDYKKEKWSEFILKELDINPDIFPEVNQGRDIQKGHYL